MSAPTIRDVARTAGVSRQTVSRVLNSRGEITPATRQRVLDVIERLGYRPNANARSLTTRRTGTVGLVLADLRNPYFTEVAIGVESAARARGYNVFLCSGDEDPEREAAVIRSLQEQRADGLILCGSRLPQTQLERIITADEPVVLLNRHLEGRRTATLWVDFARGGYLGTTHLLAIGRRRIGVVAAAPTSDASSAKLIGYRAALLERGLEPDPQLVIYGEASMFGGEIAARTLLQRTPRPDALWVTSELLAVGALHACALLGLRVPEDVAIVGFGGTHLSAMIYPSLSSVDLPLRDMGERAFGQLWRIMADGVTGLDPIRIEPALVVRDSTATGQPRPDSFATIAWTSD